MTPSHRGAHSSARSRPWPLRALYGLVGAGVITGSFFGVRAIASGEPTSAGEQSFTGTVTEFADDGAVLCVRREGASNAAFCDLFYLRPGTPEIEVGDQVVVTTITTQDEDGTPVAGMIVDPLP
jgi:hypothetical protein